MIVPQSHHCNTSSGDGAEGKLCATNLRVASSIPAEQLSIFSTIFLVLTKSQSFRAQTAFLLPPTSSPFFAISIMGSYEDKCFKIKHQWPDSTPETPIA